MKCACSSPTSEANTDNASIGVRNDTGMDWYREDDAKIYRSGVEAMLFLFLSFSPSFGDPAYRQTEKQKFLHDGHAKIQQRIEEVWLDQRQALTRRHHPTIPPSHHWCPVEDSARAMACHINHSLQDKQRAPN